MKTNFLNPWANVSRLLRIASGWYLICIVVLMIIGISLPFDKKGTFMDWILKIRSPETREGLMHDSVFRAAALTTFATLFLMYIVRFLLFRRGTVLVETLWQQNVPSKSIVRSVRRLARLFLANFSLGAVCVLLQWFLALRVDTSAIKTGPVPFLSPWVEENVTSLFLPSFPGATSLIMGLLLYLVAHQVEERSKLENQVTELREETQLTI